MELNFKEALAALARAFPAYLFYAGALALGGLLVLLEFAVFLIALRLARITTPAATPILAALILLGGWLTIALLQSGFLNRRRVIMLAMFSGIGSSQAESAVKRFFPKRSSWAGGIRRLRRAIGGLAAEKSAGIGDRLAQRAFSQSVFSLAFARGGEPETALRQGLILFCSHVERTRSLARSWLRFSAIGLAALFLCLALANAFIFYQAGVPIMIGCALALVIAWLLHQAFISPLALAGVSASLLAETKGREPDPALCEKIGSLLTP